MVVLAIALCLGGEAAAAPQQAQQAWRQLDEAARAGDHPAVAALLDDLWKADREQGREATWRVLADGDDRLRPIGMELMARHGTAAELAQAAGALDAHHRRDERRWLVRRISERPGDGRAELLRPFLGDRDPLVRAAAASGLADLGHVPAVAWVVSSLQRVPTSVSKWSGDERDIEQMALWGMVRVLSGLKPRASRDVRVWVNAQRSLDELKPPEQGDPAETLEVDGNELRTSRLLVKVEIAGVPRGAAPLGLDWPVLALGLEQSVESASRAAERLFGRIHLPEILLVLADERSIGRFGGPSRGYYGFASGNKVVMRFDELERAMATLRHEYVHIIHSAMAERQPRWFSEGLAETLSRSADESLWTREPAMAQAGLRLLDQEPLWRILRWTDSGSSGESAELYQRAHLLVDFLRFGPFAAREARLVSLLGRLDRRQRAEDAIGALYGLNERTLEEEVRRWLLAAGE